MEAFRSLTLADVLAVVKILGGAYLLAIVMFGQWTVTINGRDSTTSYRLLLGLLATLIIILGVGDLTPAEAA